MVGCWLAVSIAVINLSGTIACLRRGFLAGRVITVTLFWRKIFSGSHYVLFYPPEWSSANAKKVALYYLLLL